ncbi:MAG: acyl-CoA thioesterase [Planctomycetota bacterium]|jgi:4-hydroxybenzoyl-CoA thioesterase
MASYEMKIRVRFGDIDHAGIVYYPRISHYLHVAFEEFFADRVKLPYHELLDVRRLGFPTVHSDVSYRESLAFGDTARIGIEVTRIGNSSLTMRYRIRKEGRICAEALITTACIDLDTFRPKRIPDDLREVFAAHQSVT